MKCPRCKAKMRLDNRLELNGSNMPHGQRVYFYRCPDCGEIKESHRERVVVNIRPVRR